jgi:hypothetical protein
MKLPKITSPYELESLVNEIGFLPFFRCGIAGFSLEECTPSNYWFVEDVDGPWEWKGTVAEKGEIAYGKLFNKKAGFVSKKWYPYLANYRRDGYDFDTRYEDGLSNYKCKKIIDLLTEHGSLLSYELKQLGGFGKDGEKGFDTAMTLLQMQTYITVRSFEYKLDKHGQAYGWGVGRYTLSENVFGEELVTSQYSARPEDSKAEIISHIASICMDTDEKQLLKLIK